MEDPLKPRGTGDRYTTTVRIGVLIGSLYGFLTISLRNSHRSSEWSYLDPKSR